MIAPPPARCPSCNASVMMALASDPSTPIYACGSTPTRMRCVPTAPDFTASHNVAIPSGDEIRDLSRLVADYIGVPRYLVGLCTWPGCDMTAVDGRCLTHG